MRAQETIHLMQTQIDENELQRICGWNSLSILSLPVLFWFRNTNKQLHAKARFCATTIDYLNYRLTGAFVIDCSSAAITELLDIDSQQWSERLLKIAGIGRQNMPAIVKSGERIGTLSEEAAEELNLPKEVLVISGAHDQYSANIGAGATSHGDCVLSSGTAWVLLATSDRLLWDSEGLIHPGIHVLKGKYGLMTSVPSAGDSLNWFRQAFEPNFSLERLSEQARKVDPGSEGLVYIPKLTAKSGRSAFLKMDSVHELRHFARAVFEGVAFANRRHLAAFKRVGMGIHKLIMIGGGAQSSVWPAVVADVSGIPVFLPNQKESACAGAALLAGLGAGIFSSLEETAENFTRVEHRIDPNGQNTVVYDNAYQKFLVALNHV